MTRLSEELLYALVQYLNMDHDRDTLVALSTTSHVFSDAALDIIWAMPDVWTLAKCMDESIWHVEETEETLNPGESYTRRVSVMRFSVHSRPQVSFGERFAFYAYCARTLSLERGHEYSRDSQGFVSLEVLNAWADTPAQHLFPRLHTVTGGSGYACSVAGARTVLRFLTPNIHDFYMICPKDFFLDAGETEKLVTSGTGLRNLRFGNLRGDQQAAQLLASTFARASTQYETVHSYSPLPSSVIPHLGQSCRLRHATLELVGPAPQGIPASAFGSLTQLHLHDPTKGLPGMHFSLALSPHIRLQSFSYRMQVSLDKMIHHPTLLNHLSLLRFLQHIMRWVTLTSISLNLCIEDDTSSLEGCRAIYTHFHALPHLQTLKWMATTSVILDNTFFCDFLDACPNLADWIILKILESYFRGISVFEVSLLTFVGLLSTHPNIRRLLVQVRCNKMPSSKALANCGVSRYKSVMAVTGVEDPDAVAGVLRQVAPGVKSCFFEVGRNQLADAGQSIGVAELNKLLR